MIQELDYPLLIKEIIRDITLHVDAFKRIRPHKIVISSTPSHGQSRGGLWSYLMPLRFENGRKTKVHRKRRVTEKYSIAIRCQRVRKLRAEAEKYFLYYMGFAVPRFFKLTLTEKLETIFHELYHISPDFNGDLRRFPGRYVMHGHSMKKYDTQIRSFRKEYMQKTSARKLIQLLAMPYKDLIQKYDEISFPHFKEPEQRVTKVLAG